MIPAGFLAAVEWLNANISNILPVQTCSATVTVHPFMLDSSRTGINSKTRALRHADQLYKCGSSGDEENMTAEELHSCSAEATLGHNVHAVIADQYSSTVTTIAMMAEIHGRPMIGYGSTSDALSNKLDFPFFSRVVAPDKYQAPFLAKMVHSFGWRHIGILNGHGSYAAGFATTFAAKCGTFLNAQRNAPDPILVEERHIFTEGDRDTDTMDALLRTIQDAGVKIIMLSSAGYADTIFVLERAHILGMTGGGYIWVGADGWMSADDFKDTDATATNRLKEFTHGSVGIFHYTDASATIVAETEMYGSGASSGWHALASRLDSNWTIPGFTRPYDAWGYYVWDATVHTVRALAMASRSCFDSGNCSQQAIRTHNTYFGATGRVELNASTGDRKIGRYVILNVNKDDPRILVPIGVIEGDAWGEPVVTISPAHWASIVWPNGATGRDNIVSDGDWSSSSEVEVDTDLAIGLGLGFGIPILLLLGFMHFYRKKKIRRSREKKAQIAVAVKEKNALQKQLTDLQESMASTMEVKTPWAGIGAKADAINAHRNSISIIPRRESQIKVTVQEFYSRWYWEEDEHNLHKHNKFMIKAPCWVEYAGSVSAELESQYQKFQKFNRAAEHAEHKTDLADRISTTGNEQKAHNAHTGTKYTVNFLTMSQRNDHSGFSRKMLRDELQRNVTKYRDAPTEEALDEAALDGICINVKTTNAFSSDSVTSFLEADIADQMPLDFEVEHTLPLHIGQLIQVHKKRTDGYWHGSIIYDKDDADNDHAGWFPGVNLTKASAKITAEFQAKIGGAGADALAVPKSWDDQPDKLHAQMFDVPLSSAEARGKINEFMKTLNRAPPRVISLRRVQNVPMWQSYAVKKITMMNRAGARDNWEKTALFHGTDEDTAKKIMQQGFNRNFSGLNATYFGKGVYFARDASYSSSKTYARPNAAGLQCMFLCRVLTGEYCQGVKDAKAPDVLDAATNRLYDTTVDNMSSPGIFVTYHDAQVYPEYLIQFKQ